MMDVLGNEIDPYKTWDPTEATDDADGLPDVGMVSLVEALRSAYFITYQSCFGHPRESDGTLWIATGPGLLTLAKLKRRQSPFSRIQEVHLGPEGYHWEWWWEPERADAAVSRLAEIYGVQL